MATQQIGGMFGLSPEDIAAQRQAQITQQSMDFASKSPSEQSMMMAYQAGAGLGDAVGGAMGYQNPAAAKAQKLQQIAQQFDTTTPDGLRKAAIALKNAGLYNEAMLAVDKANQITQVEQANQIALRKQDFAENQAFELEKMQIEAQIQAAKDKLENQRLSASEANQTKLLIAQGNQQMRMLIGQMAAAGKTAKPSIGETAADKQFGIDYAKYQAAGGSAEVEKNLRQLSEVQSALSEPGNAYTGAAKALIPESVRAFTSPEAVDARNKVEQSIQSSLRTVLGAQFTQKEGESLLARTYNPRLTPAQNAQNVQALIEQIRTAAQVKEDAARYFEENGTLKGWHGRIPQLSDFGPKPASAKPLYATDGNTRIMSTDGGKTWKPVGAK